MVQNSPTNAREGGTNAPWGRGTNAISTQLDEPDKTNQDQIYQSQRTKIAISGPNPTYQPSTTHTGSAALGQW